MGSSTGNSTDRTEALPAQRGAGADRGRPADADGPARRTRQPTWSERIVTAMGPAAYIGTALGVIVLVIGVVTLARTGIPSTDLTQATTAVGPFERTALMGIIEIIFGLLLIGAGTAAGNGLTGLGLVALVFGLVWLIEPGAFQNALGIDRPTAWLYLALGLVAVVAGLAGGGQRVVHERVRTR